MVSTFVDNSVLCSVIYLCIVLSFFLQLIFGIFGNFWKHFCLLLTYVAKLYNFIYGFSYICHRSKLNFNFHHKNEG